MPQLPATPAATLAQGLAVGDNPDAYLPRDRRRALVAGRAMPDRVHGAALFADISGFTALTEALAVELGPQRGAEELTANIDRVFHAVIEQLDRHGGDVIYFAGDAITGWLDGDDGLRATAAAQGMLDAIQQTGAIVTPGGTRVELAMKVAIAVGPARRFVVGDPGIQLMDVLAGHLIDDLAEAEHHAGPNEVVLDASAHEALDGRVRLRSLRPGPRGELGVVDRLLVDVAQGLPIEPPPLPDDLVSPWLLPAVYERLRTGRGEFLAELRPAYPLFLSFAGIDYDEDDEAIGKLDDFVRRAQRVMARYGGNLLQLTLGDKGAYLYGVFGSPIAHEDDAARAVSAALELRDLERSTVVRDVRIGITHGRLRSGTYGHSMRRTFVCLGDAVNLAARLMTRAPAGGIYATDQVRSVAGDRFAWEPLPDLAVKGRTRSIVAHALTGSVGRTSRRRSRHDLPLAGRRAELERLEAALAAAAGGQGRVLAIEAEAGMGKSRLVAEFARSARGRDIAVAMGECQAFGTESGYAEWREIWRRLLRLGDGATPDREGAELRARLEAIDPALAARLPLLGTVVGVDIPDTDLTAAFDAKLRKTSLEDLLVRVLRAMARDTTVAIVLEDCHWIDELSRDLLDALARAATNLRALVVVTYRATGSPGGGLGLERLPAFEEIKLGELDPAEARELIRAKVQQVLGRETAVPAPLVDLVTRRSEGNPFYIEELVNFVARQGIDLADPAAIRSIELPDSLHSLVLSRIDTLAEAPRRTLKVASVIGRVFTAPTLPEVYPELGRLDDVRGHLVTARAVDLVRIDRVAEEDWLFKHIVTQEVAYESMPFRVRATLHRRVGSYIEQSAGDALEQQLDVLAHHFWHSDDDAKKVEYLSRAADAAQAAYANSAASDYLERLLPLLSGADRVRASLKLGKIRELVGNRAGAAAIELEALALAEELGDVASQGWCHAALAEVAQKQGRFDEATSHLDRARALFGEVGADDGLGQVLHLAGTVAAQRGDYPTAQSRYEDSLAIRERLGDKRSMGSLFSNLAIIAEYRGDYPAAADLNRRALDLRTQIGDRWAIGNSQNNLGMIALHEGRFEEARERLEDSIRLNLEVGDPWMLAIARNNLGTATRELGEHAAAREHYAASLRGYRDLDDRWALGFLLEDVAILAEQVGRREQAFELLGAAESLRAQTGTPRGPSLEEELAGKLRAAREALGAETADAALGRGRALELGAALDLALRICRPEGPAD